MIRLEENELAPPLQDQWALGPHHLLDYVKTDGYKSYDSTLRLAML